MDKSVPCTTVDLVILSSLRFHHSHVCSRDIPLPLVSSGCENSGNLRELALQRMKDFGTECRDVRFREVGVRDLHLSFLPGLVVY